MPMYDRHSIHINKLKMLASQRIKQFRKMAKQTPYYGNQRENFFKTARNYQSLHKIPFI